MVFGRSLTAPRKTQSSRKASGSTVTASRKAPRLSAPIRQSLWRLPPFTGPDDRVVPQMAGSGAPRAGPTTSTG